ncbi:MAG: hypothetical protein HFF84_13760 [Oscillibacter sp.]|nr:hypothetical protein [Oscillibacter sp.]
MEAIDIARKLAGLGSAAEAQEAYKLAVHQGGSPAETTKFRIQACVNYTTKASSGSRYCPW